jgi:periplasmic protein TonB
MPQVPGYTFLRLDETTADATAFGQRADRAGGALGTSIAMHALFLLLAWGVTRMPPRAPASPPATIENPMRFVFSALDGPSGGGGGGGNRSPKPAVRAQTIGRDAMAIAVARPAPLTPPASVQPETPPSALELIGPFKPMDAGQMQQLGIVNGPSAPPSDARGAGTAGVAGTGTRGGSGDGDGPGVDHGRNGGFGGGDVYLPGDGVSAPSILYQTRPQYTAEAMRAKIQGVTLLAGVVAPDGTLRDIRVARSLDGTFGLDREAMKCVRQWKFRPGMRLGKPVPVAVTIEVAFNLR